MSEGPLNEARPPAQETTTLDGGPSEAEPEAPPPPPSPTERYTLGDEVGSGGMGRVLRAQDNGLLRPVAMKVLHGKRDRQAQRRFVQEAQVTSQLDHPGVLPVYELGAGEDGRPFFTMKLIPEHETLADVIQRLQGGDRRYHARYTFQRRVQIVQQLCQALHYAHERGVVHRDIKPANIVLGSFGEVYLLDWGVAKVAGRQEPGEGVAPVNLTTDPLETDPGALLGTPAYMAPEQIGDPDAVDAISDVYSLATVLYEFLTLHYYLGEMPDRQRVLYAIVSKTPPWAESYKTRLNGRVPRVLSRILERALAKDRAARYQSARELELALQQWFEGTAPIVCAGTCMQRILARWSNAVDSHPFLIPTATLVVAALFLRWTLVTAGEMWALLTY